MKQIKIDPDKLTEYLIDVCPHLQLSDKLTRYCSIKQRKVCKVPLFLRDECPIDCPHFANDSTLCEGAKCKQIQETLKGLKDTTA